VLGEDELVLLVRVETVLAVGLVLVVLSEEDVAVLDVLVLRVCVVADDVEVNVLKEEPLVLDEVVVEL